MRTSGMAGTLLRTPFRAARREHPHEGDAGGRGWTREQEANRRDVVVVRRLAQDARRVGAVHEHVLARREAGDVERLTAEVGGIRVGEARRKPLHDPERVAVAAATTARPVRRAPAERRAVAEAVADLVVAGDQPAAAVAQLVALEADEVEVLVA